MLSILNFDQFHLGPDGSRAMSGRHRLSYSQQAFMLPTTQLQATAGDVNLYF